jgi:hypothetical protein
MHFTAALIAASSLLFAETAVAQQRATTPATPAVPAAPRLPAAATIPTPAAKLNISAAASAIGVSVSASEAANVGKCIVTPSAVLVVDDSKDENKLEVRLGSQPAVDSVDVLLFENPMGVSTNGILCDAYKLTVSTFIHLHR